MALYYAVQMRGDNPVLMSQFATLNQCKQAVSEANETYEKCGVNGMNLRVAVIMDEVYKPKRKHAYTPRLTGRLYTEEQFMDVYRRYIAMEINSREAAEELGVCVNGFTGAMHNRGLPSKTQVYGVKDSKIVLCKKKRQAPPERPYKEREFLRACNLYENYVIDTPELLTTLNSDWFQIMRDAQKHGFMESSYTNNRWVDEFFLREYSLYIHTGFNVTSLAGWLGVSVDFIREYMRRKHYPTKTEINLCRKNFEFLTHPRVMKYKRKR